jgi:hypothetical protein
VLVSYLLAVQWPGIYGVRACHPPSQLPYLIIDLMAWQCLLLQLLLLPLDLDSTLCDARAFSLAEDEHTSARYVRYTGYRIL